VLERVVPLIRERLKLLSEAPALTAFFFEEVSPELSSLEVLKDESSRRMLSESRLRLAGVEPFDAPRIEEALREAAGSLGMKPRAAFQPVRLAVTGSKVSPPLFESMEIVGLERCLGRLDRALELAEELEP
jgi:glutamyl-tRNA synthetase